MSKPELHEELCGCCNGSGEGRASETRCAYCRGSGILTFDEEGELFEKETFPGDDDFRFEED